jgi:hypothetical protein
VKRSAATVSTPRVTMNAPLSGGAEGEGADELPVVPEDEQAPNAANRAAPARKGRDAGMEAPRRSAVL